MRLLEKIAERICCGDIISYTTGSQSVDDALLISYIVNDDYTKLTINLDKSRIVIKYVGLHMRRFKNSIRVDVLACDNESTRVYQKVKTTSLKVNKVQMFGSDGEYLL